MLFWARGSQSAAQAGNRTAPMLRLAVVVGVAAFAAALMPAGADGSIDDTPLAVPPVPQVSLAWPPPSLLLALNHHGQRVDINLSLPCPPEALAPDTGIGQLAARVRTEPGVFPLSSPDDAWVHDGAAHMREWWASTFGCEPEALHVAINRLSDLVHLHPIELLRCWAHVSLASGVGLAAGSHSVAVAVVPDASTCQLHGESADETRKRWQAGHAPARIMEVVPPAGTAVQPTVTMPPFSLAQAPAGGLENLETDGPQRRRIRVALLDTNAEDSTLISGQKRVFAQLCQHLPGEGFDVEYWFMGTGRHAATAYPSDTHDVVFTAGDPDNTVVEEALARTDARVVFINTQAPDPAASGQSIDDVVASLRTLFRDANTWDDVSPVWQHALGHVYERMRKLDMVVLWNRQALVPGIDNFLGELARLAGVTVRLMDLPLLHPEPGPASFTGFVAPSAYACGHPSVVATGIPCHVVHPGIDVAWFAHTREQEPVSAATSTIAALGRSPMVLFVGRLDADKSPGLFLRAAAAIADADARRAADTAADAVTVPATRFVVAGDGSLNTQLRSLAVELGIADKVMFVGAVSEELPYLLHRANVLVNPSLFNETFGFVNLEAMAAGTPTVGFMLGGAREVVVNGSTSLIVDAFTPDALAAATLHLLHSPGAARDMSAAGVRRARLKFDAKVCVKGVAAPLYRRLLHEAEAASPQGAAVASDADRMATIAVNGGVDDRGFEPASHKAAGDSTLVGDGVSGVAANDGDRGVDGYRSSDAQPHLCMLPSCRVAENCGARASSIAAHGTSTEAEALFDGVCLGGGTEPLTPFVPVRVPGLYSCACCGHVLFNTNQKYDSGSGWPSFWAPAKQNSLVLTDDGSCSECGARIEMSCARCGAHLGHVFDDGPQPTGLRFCTNSVCIAHSDGYPPGFAPNEYFDGIDSHNIQEHVVVA